MATETRVNIDNWLKKVNLTKQALAQAVAKAVDWSLQEVYKETDKNLTGPNYGSQTVTSKTGKEYKIYNRGPLTNAGILPVPIVSSQLKRSLTMLRISPTIGFVFTDNRKCQYNKLIHDGGWAYYFGTRFYMKSRRYLGNVITTYRPIIQARMKYEILEAIREEGQK